jgi:hypothetical protein
MPIAHYGDGKREKRCDNRSCARAPRHSKAQKVGEERARNLGGGAKGASRSIVAKGKLVGDIVLEERWRYLDNSALMKIQVEKTRGADVRG